ncbi:Minor extracellular protease Vpr-like protein [Cladobotryum mycophilum]|uniref:Minor extracellular protease Vpr-like protein n=1 Tax=Cladobotryum mycophilum TaxID=491253 RepID=A0ABR0SBV3_9HYPO
MVRSAVIASLLAAAASTFAKTSTRNVIPGAYIFEFEEGHDPSNFYHTLGNDGETRMEFNYKLFKGVSIQLKNIDNAEETAMRIAEAPMVKQMWPVQLIPAPNPRVDWVADDLTDGGDHAQVLARTDKPKSDNLSVHTMTQIDKLRAKGITGRGIKVAVIDTGIDYLHPALGGCFGKGCLVSYGTDLVGDAYNGANKPIPDNDPMDCGGHGTHVAGIVAAQENPYGFTGAAPDVTLGGYRVFGCSGSAGNDVLIAAYNKAFEDGSNIITASIGGPSGWSEEPWAVVVSRIVQAGVPCTVAAGNEGSEGLFYASTAAGGKGVTAIASVNNILTPTVYSLANFTIENSDPHEFSWVPGHPGNWDNVSLPLYALNTNTAVPDDACKALPANTPDLGEFIVLIRRGTCTFVQKAQNLAAVGAKYVMVYDNGVGPIPIDISTVPQILGAGMVDAAQGYSWMQQLNGTSTLKFGGNKVTLHMTSASKSVKKVQVSKNSATGGALSDFTTWGPTWELDVKPQFSAPGGNILSTYPRALGSYATLSGTSMATPMAAGIYALIAQVRNSFDPTLIENLLAANANPQLFNDGSKFYEFLAPVAQQGSGLIQAYDAAYATTLLSHSSLSFNDTDHFVKVRNFTINNTGKKPVTYKLSHKPAETFYTFLKGETFPAPFPNEPLTATASLEISETNFTLPAGQAATIEISPTPPSVLIASGLSGSLYSQTVLNSTNAWIAKSTDKDNTRVADKTAFTIPPPGVTKPGAVLPALAVNLALGSPYIRADIVALNVTSDTKLKTTNFFGTKSIGQPVGYPSLYGSRGLGASAWNGQLSNGNYVPPGEYKIVVRALRIFGDAKKKGDWNISETAAFSISYA